MATSISATSGSFPDPKGNWQGLDMAIFLTRSVSKTSGMLHQQQLLGKIPFLEAVRDRVGWCKLKACLE